MSENTTDKTCRVCGKTYASSYFVKGPNKKPTRKCVACFREEKKKKKVEARTAKKQLKSLVKSGNQELATMATTWVDANKAISNIRDSVSEMTAQLLSTTDLINMEAKDQRSFMQCIETANRIIITNTLFLKQNIDLSTATDEELVAMAQALLPDCKAATMDAEIVEETKDDSVPT